MPLLLLVRTSPRASHQDNAGKTLRLPSDNGLWERQTPSLLTQQEIRPQAFAQIPERPGDVPREVLHILRRVQQALRRDGIPCAILFRHSLHYKLKIVRRFLMLLGWQGFDELLYFLFQFLQQ